MRIGHISHVLRGLLGGLALATTSGCLLPETPAPVIPLTKSEQSAVLACQKAMSQQTSRLWSKAYKEYESCSRAALSLQLERERELDGGNAGQYDQRRAKVVAKCDAGFARVGKATTRMIDQIRDRCEPVEVLVFDALGRGDPLGWQTMNAALAQLGGDTFESVEVLSSALCGAVVADVEETLTGVVARASDLIHKYYKPANSQEFYDHLRSSIDPRCVFEVS